MSLSPSHRDQFIPIIDSILSRSDLNTISEKRIRKGVQEAVGYDLTPQKAAIKQLIMERFDVFAEKKGINAPSPENDDGQRPNSATPLEPSSPSQSSTAQKRQADSAEQSDDTSSRTPPPKKQKPRHDVDADALYAAKLQAEENLRARPTRGGNTRGGNTRKAPSTKKKTTKTAKKIKAEDDSDIGSGSDSGKKVNRSGGFHKPLNLSPALSALLGGEPTLSRPQTVKKVWQYIREHDLQDPSDRRQIRCDDAMRAVFKQDRIHMFTMTKVLSQNLYSPDE
ncbi:SWIB-domain-containing protein [Aspergillus californicus]